jgi:hypothetical protein
MRYTHPWQPGSVATSAELQEGPRSSISLAERSALQNCCPYRMPRDSASLPSEQSPERVDIRRTLRCRSKPCHRSRELEDEHPDRGSDNKRRKETQRLYHSTSKCDPWSYSQMNEGSQVFHSLPDPNGNDRRRGRAPAARYGSALRPNAAKECRTAKASASFYYKKRSPCFVYSRKNEISSSR